MNYYPNAVLPDLFELVLEEAVALQTWSVAEKSDDFSLTASFQLTGPVGHNAYSQEQMLSRLKEYRASEELLKWAVTDPVDLLPEGFIRLQLRNCESRKKSVETTQVILKRIPLADVSVGNDCRC